MDLEEKRALYPRVSDIIGKQNCNELKSVPIDVLANACIRGEKIHRYCTAFLNNLWVDDIEPEYVPYFEAFQDWAQKNVSCAYHSNVRLYDDVKRFTGEFDLIVKLHDGRLALLDIKTSCNKSKTWPVQLAAYGHLCEQNGYKFDVVYNVHLKKTKSAEFEEKEGEKILISPPQVKTCPIEYIEMKPFWEIFSSALKCYDYFDRKEPKNVKK